MEKRRIKTKKFDVALCEARHPMPENVSGSIFPQECGMDFDQLQKTATEWLVEKFGEPTSSVYAVYPTAYNGYSDGEFLNVEGKLTVYVTGFTPALIAVINACRSLGLYDLTLMHYDRASCGYIPQKIVW